MSTEDKWEPECLRESITRAEIKQIKQNLQLYQICWSVVSMEVVQFSSTSLLRPD